MKAKIYLLITFLICFKPVFADSELHRIDISPRLIKKSRENASNSPELYRNKIQPTMLFATLQVGDERDIYTKIIRYSGETVTTTKMILAKQINRQNQFTKNMLTVNVWVEKAAYNDPQLNNLNTNSKISDLEKLQQDRLTVVDEIANTMAEWILPTSEFIFGQLNDATNTPVPGLNIFVYDINDGFNGSGGFVGGYFDPDDKDLSSGNRMNALHMDIYPSVVGGYDKGGFGLRRIDFYHVLAHELQHVIHHQYDPHESAWANEGFSQFTIYRMFHGKDFFNGERNMVALKSPSDAAAQAKFWLKNPRTARLMDNDSNNYGTELRGLGYLFFCYLWEQIGGNFDVENLGDAAFRQMIASTESGRLSLIAGLESEAEFNEIFDDFPAALLLNSGHEKFRTYFFQEHYISTDQDFRLKFDSCNSPGCSIASAINSGMNPITYPLKAYDFWFIKFYGNNSFPAVVELSSSSSFNSFSIPIVDGLRTLKEYNSGENHLVYVPKDAQQILVLSNPSTTPRDITLSFKRYLSAQTGLAMNYRATTIPENDYYSTSPLEISAAAVTGQSFLHENTGAIDLLNNLPEKIVISARQPSDSCMDSTTSDLLFSHSTHSPKQAFNISGTNYYQTGLQLEPDTAYKICFLNKTQESVSFSPRITSNKIISDPDEARQSFRGNPPNVTDFRSWLDDDTIKASWSVDDKDRRIHKIILSTRKLAPQAGTLQTTELNRSASDFSLNVTTGELWELSIATKSYQNVNSIDKITKSIWIKAESTVNTTSEINIFDDWKIADKNIETLQIGVKNGEEIRFFKYLQTDITALTNTESALFTSNTTLSNGAIFFPETLFNFNFGKSTEAYAKYKVQQSAENVVVYHFNGTEWVALSTEYIKDLKADIVPDNTNSNYSIVTIYSKNGAGSPFTLGYHTTATKSINTGPSPTDTDTSPASGNGGGCTISNNPGTKGWTNVIFLLLPLFWLILLKLN